MDKTTLETKILEYVKTVEKYQRFERDFGSENLNHRWRKKDCEKFLVELKLALSFWKDYPVISAGLQTKVNSVDRIIQNKTYNHSED